MKKALVLAFALLAQASFAGASAESYPFAPIKCGRICPPEPTPAPPPPPSHPCGRCAF